MGPGPGSKGTQAGNLCLLVWSGVQRVGSVMNNSFKCQLLEWEGLRHCLQATILRSGNPGPESLLAFGITGLSRGLGWAHLVPVPVHGTGLPPCPQKLQPSTFKLPPTDFVF